MYYGNSKVYFDGSHYIAIPQFEKKPKRHRVKKPEKEVTVIQDKEREPSPDKVGEPSVILEEEKEIEFEEVVGAELPFVEEVVVNENPTMTLKEIFNVLYAQHINLKRSERKKTIVEEMQPYFSTQRECKFFVQSNFERKTRNLMTRRIRMLRKANLANFNYFCTFTYDSEKHNEESFKKKLRSCFKMMCHRKSWKYMGVWERAPETNRLHFHGLFYIPDIKSVGELKMVRDYDTINHQMKITYQSSYFNKRFGRSDFEIIDNNENKIGNAIAYLVKYIEKTGEKIVYSKGLPQYFISDILEDDIVCNIGIEDRKLLLFDDFRCLTDGELIGNVSQETISKLRTAN